MITPEDIAAADAFIESQAEPPRMITRTRTRYLPNAVAVFDRVQKWQALSDSGLRLKLGEATAQEIRTVRAVLNSINPP